MANSLNRAITVPSAAPSISIFGAPRAPKMNTQLKKILTKNEIRELKKPSFTRWTVRKMIISVRETPCIR